MAIITYPLNNIEYTAEDAELYHATRTSGVFANDDFPITVSGDGNVVTIGEGIGWIRNSKFSGKVVANKAEMSLDLGLPHATYPRIDAVVLQFNANANASEIIVKNGTAQTNPTPPEVVRTESVYELHLYHVYREAGAASVIASNVTDLRSDSDYCGIMSDDVTMLGDDYVRKNMVGVANGVASLDGSGKVPESQLPSMDYIPTSQKGAASGVASLDGSGKVPSGQLNLSSSVSSTSTTTVANSAAVKTAYDKAVEANSIVHYTGTLQDGNGTGYTLEYAINKCGKIATVRCTFKPGSTGTGSDARFIFPEDILQGYLVYYSWCPLPVIGDSTDASGSKLFGYAYWGANLNIYVDVRVSMLSGKTGYACFTMISEI